MKLYNHRTLFLDFFHPHLRTFFSLLTERERRREGGRDIYLSPPMHTPTRNRTYTLVCVLESNLGPFSLLDNAPTNWATSSRAPCFQCTFPHAILFHFYINPLKKVLLLSPFCRCQNGGLERLTDLVKGLGLKIGLLMPSLKHSLSHYTNEYWQMRIVKTGLFWWEFRQWLRSPPRRVSEQGLENSQEGWWGQRAPG